MKASDKQGSANGSGVYAWYVVAVLMLAYMVAFIDRQILSLLVEPIKRDFGVNDTQVGLLAGFAFVLFYSVLGVPIARLADRKNRKGLICLGVIVWSVMTAACGLTKNYWQLFMMRVGVGVGEGTLSPAAYSIIADYFPSEKLAKALGVYSMGLYLGAGIAMLVGSAVVSLVGDAEALTLPYIGAFHPWQLSFFIVAIPGLIVVGLMMTVKEPARTSLATKVNEAAIPEAPATIQDLLAFYRSNRRLLLAHFGGFLCLGTVISAYLVWVPELFRRSHGFSVAESGTIFGVCLLASGCSAPYIGGWLSEQLWKRGHLDAEMRAGAYAAILMLPFAVLTPLVTDAVTGIVFLGLLTFTLALPQAYPPTILQIITPNRMRAQFSALFILFSVLIGFSLGPALTAVMTDYLFGNPEDLRYSLALLSALLVPSGMLCLFTGIAPYREKMNLARASEAQS